MINLNTIKNWFRTGLKPTQTQFWAAFDSFWHKEEQIPLDKIDGIQNVFDNKVDKVAGKNLSTNDLTDVLKARLLSDRVINVSSDNVNHTLTFDFKDGNDVTIDLSALVVDIHTNGLSLVGETLHLLDTDGSELTLDLSQFITSAELTENIITLQASYAVGDGVDAGDTQANFNTEATQQISDNTNDIVDLQDNKVDKVTGKGLSTNDFTNNDKNFLYNLHPDNIELDSNYGTIQVAVGDSQQDFNSEVDAFLEDLYLTKVSKSTWITPTLNKGWVNYNGSSYPSGYRHAGYKKEGNRVVMKGLVKRTSETDNIIFTLPVGYRPEGRIILSPYGDRVDVLNNGDVVLASGSADLVSLELSFDI